MIKILRRNQSSIWNKVARSTRESEARLLGRRIGIESEFFVRHPHEVTCDSLADFTRVIRNLDRRIPLAPSKNNPFRFFLANGSSVSLELGGFADLHGALYETATPECTSPRDLLTYELANEQLLEQAFSQVHPQQAWALIKSNTDGHGHTLGQHESYDMRIASRGWLLLWWGGLLAMLPALVAYRMLAGAWMLLVYALCAATCGLRRCGTSLWRLVTCPARFVANDAEVANHGFLEDMKAPWSETLQTPFLTAFWMQVAAHGLRWLHWPIVFAFGFLIQAVALRPHRRRMTAFLATRCVLEGAGYVDEQNRFWVSQRASMVNRVIGFGSYGGSRPIFRCDPLLRDLLSGPFWSFRRFSRLFRRRQRIELAIGDSGMCQQSQYLRCGTTSLVLDMVEFGDLKKSPKLRSPVHAIREFARDWMLVRSMPDRRNRNWSAVELQRWYAKQLKLWMESRGDTQNEPWQIFDLWQTTLNQMVLRPSEKAQVPKALVGRIDWLSKLWLLQQMEAGTAWSIRKKIDIRYHELSESGYHRKLNELIQIAPIVREEAVERARRSPPSDAAARRRGNLIREFSGATADLRVDWQSATYDLEGILYRIKF